MTEAFVPLLLLVAVRLVIPRWRPGARLSTFLMVGVFYAILARYFWWRLTVTVLPASALDAGGVVVWTVFIAEWLLWLETTILITVLTRRTNRSAEADAHEARLSSMDPDTLPDVDIFIATYNEPLDVLEKTIAGAMGLDWPAHRLHVHVLDDGRREWLADYCAERGVNHMTRDDNKHAKAGNINAAVAKTSSPFILILDADFVPQRRMLMRAIGFFDDPEVGIVQMPHHFFNSDPVQTNLDLRNDLPDEQRFFFDVIQPGRDGWNCAFCCGSNGIIRRAALMQIGGRMPTDSITEDMLLTLALLRKGYVTRYLGERLAIGLAPESLDAYYLQRARWAQGAIQILYIDKGPLGPGLRFMQRLLFVPSHWISQSICQPIAMATPAFFLLTGIPPLVNATTDQIVAYQLPAVVGGVLVMKFFAPESFFPLNSTVQSVMQAFRIMPIVFSTLVKPTGHGFKVTPKGSDAGVSTEDTFTIKISLLILIATGSGLFLNANFSTRIVETTSLLPVVAFWAVINMVILLVIITVAVPRRVHRNEERFPVAEPCRVIRPDREMGGETLDISLSGIFIALDAPDACLEHGDWVGLELADVGLVPARIMRIVPHDETARLGLAFHLPYGPQRDRVIQKLFTNVPKDKPEPAGRSRATLKMLLRVFNAVPRPQAQRQAPDIEPPPEWLVARTGGMTYGTPLPEREAV